LYGGWSPYVDVVLGESAEEYEVDILQEGTPIRTLTTTSDDDGVVYTVADQITDEMNTVETIDIAIYQKSSIVGRGIPVYVTMQV
jgi:NADPH-dependent 2,4-dienoyl-CoA reductase/sulfur reductase-like enzyme